MALSTASQNAIQEAYETLTTPPCLPPLNEKEAQLLKLVLMGLALECERAGLRFALNQEEVKS